MIVDIEDWRAMETVRDAADSAYIHARVASGEAPIPLDEVVRQFDA